MAKTKPDPKSSAKQFSLKASEMQMLKVLQDQYMTHVSNFLSFIAIERLAYNVTPNTKYTINNGNLTIEEDASAAAEQPPPETDVATAPATTGGQ